jgi:phospholipid/cholesterol/gamma-HCH transport system ATP-binding protein
VTPVKEAFILECRDLTKRFDGRAVLKKLSLAVKRDEILAILGTSGGGKSVLIQHMAGLLKPDAGTTLYQDRAIEKMNHDEKRDYARHIGYMFQYGALFDSLNVGENLALPLREHTRLSSNEVTQQIRETLRALDLHGVESKMPFELSGGMLKRVGLARALIQSPKILFCDEPCSGLDPVRKKLVYELIRRARDRFRATVIVVTHDTESVPFFADRLALLHQGRIVALENDWKNLSKTYQAFVEGESQFLEENADGSA